MNQKILVIDDDAAVLDVIEADLEAAGFSILPIHDATSAVARVKLELPSLVILDLMCANMSGLEICKALRSDAVARHIPIILLTARADEVDKIVGLELGADDYITKPFSPRELLLRIYRSLRVGARATDEAEVITVGDLVLDHARHEVRVEKQVVRLTSIEFKLLTLLMNRRGRVQSRDRLLNDVWGYESAVDTRAVDTHVKRLRQKLGPAAVYIESVRGVGYRVNEAVESRAEESNGGELAASSRSRRG